MTNRENTGGRSRRNAVLGSVHVAEILESRRLLTGSAPVAFGTLDSNLNRLYEQSLHAGPSPADGSGLTQDLGSLSVVDGSVTVDSVAIGDAKRLASQIKLIGGTGVSQFGNVVSSRVPIGSLAKLAGLGQLRFAQGAQFGLSAGSVQSQGDNSLRAQLVRNTTGFDGTGVKIGVLSDSYNNLNGAAADIASGDLPAAGVQVIQDFASGGTDEGRAMLQIVHDVAPGASLAFATANGGQAVFANNIIALANAGCKVIVDDVYYYADPMFQDGVISQAISTVVGMGVSYFTAAGNNASQGYESAWRSAPVRANGSIPASSGSFFGGTPFDFDPGAGVDDMLFFSMPGSRSFNLSVAWDSPNASVSGAVASPNDIDVYVLNGSGTTVLFGDTTVNTNGDAVATLGITSGSGGATGNIMIVTRSGATPSFIKAIRFGNSSNVSFEYAFDKGTTFGHLNAASGMSVASAPYTSTPAYGVTPPVRDSFSSMGTTPILFDTAGARLGSPVIRNKPDFTAPDGANVAHFGSNLNPFFGTSAAAPHAAAVAGLMLQAAPSATPAQVYASIRSGAIDMDDPRTAGFDAGYDTATGDGLIQADAAIAAILPLGVWTGLGDDASWTDTGNWSQKTLPAATTDVVINILANPTIAVTGTQSVRSITAAEALNITGSLTVAQASTLASATLASTGTLGGAGNVSITSQFSWNAGGAMTGAGSLNINSGASMSITGAAHVGGKPIQILGSAQVAAGAGAVVVVPALTIASGYFDLADGTLIVDYSGANPTSTLVGYLTSGRNSGAWNGNGIRSSSVPSLAGTLLGYAASSAMFSTFPATFAGQSIDNTALLVRYTYAGDTNLDRKVDIVDLGKLAGNWQATGRTFSQGDSNYDGKVDIVDLGALATNWQKTVPGFAPLTVGTAAMASPLPTVPSSSRRRIVEAVDQFVDVDDLVL